VFVLTAAFLRGHSADEAAAGPEPDVLPGRAYFVMQQSPRSVAGEAGFVLDGAIDDFVDVIDYRNAAFDRSFFFAGGGGGLESAAFRGGWAGRPGGNYLGLYFSGDLFYGRGSKADKDDSAYANAAYNSYDEIVANDNLIVLFAAPLLGGFRFDLRFDQAAFTSLETKTGETRKTATPFVSTLQWGRRFGKFSPKAAVGASWGGYGTADEFDYPRLAFKLEAAYGGFAADYQLSLAFDSDVTVDGTELARKNGADHLANLSWTARTALTETLDLTARPQAQFDLYVCGNTAEGAGRTVRYGELFYFGFAPILEAALRWQIAPAIALTTGARFTLLRLEAKTREKGDAWTADTGSAWNAALAEATGGTIALAWSPSEHFSLEAGVDGIFNFNESDYTANLTNLTGGFAFIFRL
jgi:hypothetical protein